MNANYGKLLPRIAVIMGLMSISLLTAISSPAQQRRICPKPTDPGYKVTVFNEPPYCQPATEAPTAPVSKPTQPATEVPTGSKNIIGLLEADGSFTTLAKALGAAGLTETFKGKDSYTIFAPTDAAFAKLPQDAVRDLLKPENKEVLVKVLTYHVVTGKVLSTDLKSSSVKSVEGGAINVKVDPATGVTINDAKVTKPDIQGSNGVVHAIDNVILPPDL